MWRSTPLIARFGATLLSVVLTVAACLAEAQDAVDFQADVQPIFVAHCLSCHGDETQEAGLRLDDRASLLRTGERGTKTLVPGAPRDSLLIHAVRGDDPDFVMPPEGDPLTDAEIRTLARWIAQGAVWPGQMDLADTIRSDHWSFQPPHVAAPPSMPGSVANPIDRFILSRLAKDDLSLSPPAGSVTLIRRASFVLTGLPPSPEQVAQVLNAPAGFEQAYERFIDGLLDSPNYGQRWAQHWLDVIRWAETVGFETNMERPNAWPYRDWVIESLNDDKPYDQFVFEQIAGDTSRPRCRTWIPGRGTRQSAGSDRTRPGSDAASQTR